MIRRSSIGWTDFSGGDLNFVIGCTPVSEGCANCYARRIVQDRGGHDFGKVRVNWEKLARLRTVKFMRDSIPFHRWPDARPMAFVVDMGDLFHPDVPDSFLLEAFHVMAGRKDVDWQLLTKRPERMARVAAEWICANGLTRLPENIWCGVTAENQAAANERVPDLIRTRAAVRFVSIEPMLGPVDLVAAVGEPSDDDWDAVNRIEDANEDGEPEEFVEECEAERDWINYGHDLVVNSEHREWEEWRLWRARLSKLERSIDWVIVARSLAHPGRRAAWARSVRDVCQLAEIPFFYKQGSAFRPGQDDILDGVRWKQFPTGAAEA
jgi:protein gp37